MLLRSIAALLLALAVAGSVPFAAAHAETEPPKSAARILDELTQEWHNTADLMAARLGSTIGSAEDHALETASPMPAEIMTQLMPFFPADLLTRVRWTTLDDVDGGIAKLVMLNPQVIAITLGDVIVFRQADVAESSVSLWAHELTHVEQYERLGLEGFASAYLHDAGASL